MMNTLSRQAAWASLGLLLGGAALAQGTPSLQGDVGVAVYRTPALIRTSDSSNSVLPYVYADYGSFFARVNTLGFKAKPLGAGYLELATRVTLEGFKSTQTGIEDRAQPMPLGVGTFQKTPYGALALHGFYDTTSRGNLVDAMYVGKLRVGSLNLYPHVGVEYRSAKYVQHLYGITSSEASASGGVYAAYNASASTAPYAGFTAQYPIGKQYALTYQLRKKWWDAGVTDSPLVVAKSQTTSFLALSRAFD